MTNKLLLTTAIVAISGLSNAYADGHYYPDTILNISSGDVTNPDTGYSDYDEEHQIDAYNYKYISVSGGSLALDKFKIRSGTDLDISGGSVTVKDGGLKAHNGVLNFSNGILNATNSEINAESIRVSGGEIILSGSTDFSADSHEKNFHLSGGKITLNGGGAAIGTNEDCVASECTAGAFEMTGGEIIVNNGAPKGGAEYKSNYLEGAKINVSNSNLTINENAYLQAISGMKTDDKGEPIELYQGTITLMSGGLINLAGTLSADIEGDDNGLIVFENSNSVIDGNAKNTNLTFNADNSLSKAITGKIENLATLAIAGGSFDFDKQIDGDIQSIEVANNAKLAITNSDIKTSAKDTQTTDIKILGALSLTNSVLEAGNDAEEFSNNSDILFNGATVEAIDSDIEANGNITINNSTISLSSSKPNEDLYGIYAENSAQINKDSQISIKEGYIIADQNLQINGGNIDIQNKNVHTGDVSPVPGAKTMAGTNFGLMSDEIDISGGTTTLETSMRGIKAVKMSDGTLNLNTTQADFASTLWSYGDITLSGGTINMNSTTDDDGSNITTFVLTDKEGYTPGNILISGATLNIEGKNNMLGTSGNIVMKDGTINIKENSELVAISAMTEDGHADDDAVATIQLNGGTINIAGSLRADIDGNDRGLIVFANSNSVVDGNIESPSLTFEADHSLSKAITGEIASLDKLTVANGTLNFDKPNTADHGITTVEVANGATLDIGANTLHSTGDKKDGEGVIFKDNSTLKFVATSAEAHGQIKANYVNISNNGTTLNMNFNGAALAKDESMIIKLFDQSEDEEGVEIDGAFATLASNTRYKFTDEGNGNYKITNVADAADVVTEAGGDANNEATAVAWDNLDTSSVSNPITVEVAQKLAELSNNATTTEGKKAYIDALTALAPETAPAVQQVTTETANQVFSAVSSRLSSGSVAASRQGMSSGDAYGHNGAVWAQMLYNKSKYDKSSSTKFDADTTGAAFGLEAYFNPAVKAGIGYTYSKTDIDGFMRDTDVKTHTAIVYGEYKPNNWFVNGVATYGWSDYEEKKNVNGTRVKSDYDVEALALQAMTGYDMNINGVGFTPETGLRYVHIKNKSYKSSADERIKNSNSDIVTGVIGARVNKTYAYGYTLFKPELKAAMTYDLANDDTKSVVTLVNGSSYAVKGKALNRFGVELGAGITAEIRNNVELSLGYEGKFRKDYQDHTGLINAKYKF